MRTSVRYRGEPSEVWHAVFKRVIDASGLPLLNPAGNAEQR